MIMHITVHLPPTAISFSCSGLATNGPDTLFPGLKWIADHCCERLGLKQCSASPPALRLKIQHILRGMFERSLQNIFQREATGTSSSHTRKIYALTGFLHEHYAEKFSLTELAESVFMSRNECCRYFKQVMSMTMTEYLPEYRLSKAAELLETSD